MGGTTQIACSLNEIKEKAGLLLAGCYFVFHSMNDFSPEKALCCANLPRSQLDKVLNLYSHELK